MSDSSTVSLHPKLLQGKARQGRSSDISMIFFRYLSWQFLMSFIAVVGVLVFLIWMLDIVELLRRASTKTDVGFMLVIRMGFLKVFDSFNKILPFAALFATMICFFKLTRARELVVSRSSGMSAWQILLPVVVCAFLIGVVNVCVINPLGAAFVKKYESLDRKHLKRKDSVIDISKTGLWFKQRLDDKDYYIHAQKVSPDLQELYNVTLFIVDQIGQRNDIDRYDAEKGVFDNYTLTLVNVLHHRHNEAPQILPKTIIRNYFTKTDILESFSKPNSISFWQYPNFIRTLDKTGLPIIPYQMYFFGYLAQPFFLVAMVLFAYLFSFKYSRHTRVLLMVLGGLVCGLCVYLLNDFFFAMGMAQKIPYYIATFVPVLLGLLVAIPLIIHYEYG